MLEKPLTSRRRRIRRREGDEVKKSAQGVMAPRTLKIKNERVEPRKEDSTAEVFVGCRLARQSGVAPLEIRDPRSGSIGSKPNIRHKMRLAGIWEKTLPT